MKNQRALKVTGKIMGNRLAEKVARNGQSS